MIKWIDGPWGVTTKPTINGFGRRRWFVVFGDDQKYAYSGTYKTYRRAKREITHYISRGAGVWYARPCAPFSKKVSRPLLTRQRG
jgi:hypothetical protein